MGEGAYGKVLEGLDVKHGKKVAVKMISLIEVARIGKEVKALIELT